MSDDIDKQFRAMADSFIHLANKHCETGNRENVSMSLLYAAARFSAFVVASHASDLQKYQADRDAAVRFFSDEYIRMLNENLDDYTKVYDESMKYAHLMKNTPSS